MAFEMIEKCLLEWLGQLVESFENKIVWVKLDPFRGLVPCPVRRHPIMYHSTKRLMKEEFLIIITNSS